MIKILVCDDDKNITDKIENLLRDIKEQYNLDFISVIKNNGEAVLNSDSLFDIAIVDIEMPDMSGLELSKKLKAVNPDIIILILTSFAEYLDNAMDINVFRYLSKPIDSDRLTRSLLSAVKRYKQISKQIILEQADNIRAIKTKDILYIENLKHGSFIATKYGKFKTNKKPKEWLEIINQPNCFAYSHKSFIVNLQNVINFNRTAVIFQGIDENLEIACISQRKFNEFKKAFFEFAGGIQ